MPKGKPARSRRKRSGKPVARPPAAAAYRPPPAAPQDSEAAPVPQEAAPEPSATRFSTRDYTFVRRELRRIVLLALAIIITIVVLSFFLP